MKALTNDELDFLLGNGPYWPMPEWSYPNENITKAEKERRRRYHAMRVRMVRRGFAKIIERGKYKEGGYQVARFKLTPLAEQIVGWLNENKKTVGSLKHISGIVSETLQETIIKRRELKGH